LHNFWLNFSNYVYFRFDDGLGKEILRLVLKNTPPKGNISFVKLGYSENGNYSLILLA